jgi:hypothetical protein
MAAEVLLNAGIYVGGARVSYAFNAAKVDGDAAMIDQTGFGSGQRVFQKGIFSGMFSASGFYDAAVASALDDEWRSGNGDVFTMLENDNPGKVAFLMNQFTSRLSRGGTIAGQSTMTMEGASAVSPAVVRGKCSMRNDALVASGNGTPVQLGAVLANQSIYANLHVFSVSVGGTPSITAKIQSDNAIGFPSPTDIGSFAPATVVGAQRLVIPGAITDDWFRAVVTVNSAGTFGVMVSIGRYPLQ